MRRKVLLLATYCGGDTPGCADETPCADCLPMCNVAEVDDAGMEVIAGLDFLREQKK